MDYAITIDSATGMGQMIFDKSETILNNLFLSLTVRRGSFFQNPDFGSRLHLLHRAKNTPRTEALAVEYCKEALQWLIDAGRLSKIDIYTEIDKTQNIDRLKMLIEATKAEGDQVSFTTFVEVV